jgi:hypothetical protein
MWRGSRMTAASTWSRSCLSFVLLARDALVTEATIPSAERARLETIKYHITQFRAKTTLHKRKWKRVLFAFSGAQILRTDLGRFAIH